MTIRLQLLGPAHAHADGIWHDLPYGRTTALLVYLACQNGWASREELAELFWGETGEARARASLRQALYAVQQWSWTQDLEVERHRVRFEIMSDVEAFQEAIHRSDWSAAVTLYRGPLLEGFRLSGAPMFEEWLENERRTLHSLWREANLQMVMALEAEGLYTEALPLVQRVLAHDSLDEDALQIYLRTAKRSGQREGALRTYKQFEEQLQRELGIEPLEATVKLAKELESTAVEVMSRPSAPADTVEPPTLPVQLTPFIGRDLELAEIAVLLSDPECRLLTLVGLGGIGKTRIALQIALEKAEVLARSLHFVPLAPVDSVSDMIPTIASHIGFRFSGPQEPKTQLLEHVREKELLLVLDNFEHLVEGATLLTEMLSAAPKLKLLVTSRERLNLQGEWTFDIKGMSYPPEEEVGGFEAYDAVQLFLRSARRVDVDFRLTPENRNAVLRACRLLQGMPLGLELAASWLRIYSCEAVVKELETNLGSLETTLRDLPERHQSLGAVFEHSWRLLTREEQDVLRKLAVFRGGFHSEAASEVAGASPRILLSLINKSLMHKVSSSRFDLHEVVRQGVESLLGTTQKEEIRDRHSEYYLRWLASKHKAGGMDGAVGELLVERDNLRAAWLWAVENKNSDQIDAALDAFRHFYEQGGLHREGVELLALASRRDFPPSLKGRLLSRQGTLCFWLGDLGQAKEFLEESLRVLEPAQQAERAKALTPLGWVHARQGNYENARQVAEESLALFRALEDKRNIASALNTLASVVEFQGHYRLAKAYYQECLDICQAINLKLGIVAVLHNLANITEILGDFKETRRYTEWALEICEETKIQHQRVKLLVMMGTTLQHEGQRDEAEGYFRESLELSRHLEMLGDEAEALFHLGALAVESNDLSTAKELLEASVRLFDRVGNRARAARAHTYLGEVSRLEGNFAQAEQFLKHSVSVSEELGHVAVEVEALAYLGQLAIDQQQEQARDYLRRALEMAWSRNFRAVVLKALVSATSLMRPEDALVALSVVLEQPDCGVALKQEAQERYDKIKALLPGEAKVLDHNTEASLEEVVESILRL